MTVTSAYLIPGSPLPLLRPDAAALRPIVDGLARARKSFENAAPDTVVVYSTGWVAVVDQLWLTRPHMSGRFVDQTWHEFGHVDWEIDVDTRSTEVAIERTTDFGVKSRGCDYDAFPIDAGTIVFSQSMNATAGIPMVVTSNNLYHDWDKTWKIGQAAVDSAVSLGRSVAIVGVGGLSGSIFREGVDFAEDRIHSGSDDAANRRLIDLLTDGDVDKLIDHVPDYSATARADMGMKHLAFILGALGGRYSGAECLGYGPLCGSGGAVVEFTP